MEPEVGLFVQFGAGEVGAFRSGLLEVGFQEAGLAQLGGAQYLEQLSAAEVDMAALAQGIEADGVKLWGMQTEIDRINRDIAALGAVNLAALDELATSRERKTFLDAQNADLNEAITTLEDAIHKIDLETRDLLSSTFN